jgi:hypothetical protein
VVVQPRREGLISKGTGGEYKERQVEIKIKVTSWADNNNLEVYGEPIFRNRNATHKTFYNAYL